jgi:EpsI family protein
MRTRLIGLIVVLAITLVGVRAASRSRNSLERLPDWGAVPYELDGWIGKDATFDPVYGSDPSDTNLLRVYSRRGEPPIIVYVGFYKDLATILEVHTPELCYPAQGWAIRSVGHSGSGQFRGQPISAKEIMADKNGTKRLVTWWYNAGSKPFETRLRYVYGMLLMSTFTGRRDGSLVRIETPIGAGGETAATAQIEEFRSSFLPALDSALPR